MALEGIPTTSTGSLAFPNANRDVEHDPTIPGMIDSTSDMVEGIFEDNRARADDLTTKALETIEALKNNPFPADLPDPPAAPAIITRVDGSIGVDSEPAPNLGAFTDVTIDNLAIEDIVIPDISSTIPEYVPAVTALSIPEPPTLNLPSIPEPPIVDIEVEIPAAPSPSYGTEPVLLELEIPPYTAPTIPLFNDTAPEFVAVVPEPVIQWVEPEYASEIKDAVKAVLDTMLAGGTGLASEVEQAIHERNRAREDAGTQRAIAEAYDEFSARGFDNPQGPLDKKITALRDDRDLKVNGGSRDIAISQAELEQKNRQFAVTAGLDYERIFTGVFLAIVDRNFQIAKFGVETAVQIFNMQVAAFNVEQAVFGQKITLYRAQLEGVFTYLKAFEALVSVEKAKADMNVAKVQAYEAKVKAFQAQVDAYRALIQGQEAKANAGRAVIEGYRAVIEGKVALVQGERAKMDAYAARVGAEAQRANIEEANARAYTARVQAIGEEANIIVKQADVKIAKNRLLVDAFTARLQRASAITQADLALIQANLAGYQAATSKAVAKFGVERDKLAFTTQSQVSLANIAIEKFKALSAQWVARSTQVIQLSSIGAESLRAAGQLSTNLASGMMAGLHAAVGLSASASANEQQSTSTSNQTSQSRSLQESSSYIIDHKFNHRV